MAFILFTLWNLPAHKPNFKFVAGWEVCYIYLYIVRIIVNFYLLFRLQESVHIWWRSRNSNRTCSPPCCSGGGWSGGSWRCSSWWHVPRAVLQRRSFWGRLWAPMKRSATVHSTTNLSEKMLNRLLHHTRFHVWRNNHNTTKILNTIQKTSSFSLQYNL